MRGTSGELLDRKSAHLDKFAHLVDRRDGLMVELLSARLLTLELGRSRRGEG